MKKTILGNSGVEATAAPLGAMYLGTKQDRDQSFALLDAYVGAGGNFIDTANIYVRWLEGWQGGESETVLGEWMAARGNRNDLFIASKVGFEYQDIPQSLAPDLIKSECDKSLKRLGVDTIDLYFAHVDDRTVPQADVLGAFGELIDAGKIRMIGASNFVTHRLATANHIARTSGLPEYQVLQQRHTYLQPRYGADTGRQIVLTGDMQDYCAEAGLSIMAYSATLGGAYSGDSARPVPPDYDTAPNRARLAVLKDIAGETGVTAQQVMLAWLWSQPGMMPLIAASTTGQLEENLAAMDVTLTADQIARLESAGD